MSLYALEATERSWVPSFYCKIILQPQYWNNFDRERENCKTINAPPRKRKQIYFLMMCFISTHLTFILAPILNAVTFMGGGVMKEEEIGTWYAPFSTLHLLFYCVSSVLINLTRKQFFLTIISTEFLSTPSQSVEEQRVPVNISAKIIELPLDQKKITCQLTNPEKKDETFSIFVMSPFSPHFLFGV